MFMSRRLLIALYAGVAILSLGAVLYYTTPVASSPVIQETNAVSVSLSIEGVLSKETYAVPVNSSALTFLVDETEKLRIAIRAKEYAGMGTLIEKIGEFQNGTDGKYWMYYVNGELALVGADAYVMQEGDSIEWKFKVPEEY